MTDARGDPESEIRIDDPRLSPEANRILTREVQRAVGRDRARHIGKAAHDAAEAPARGHATLTTERALLVITFATLLVVGVIVSLETGSWWAVVAAAAAHALGTLVVVGMTLQMITEVEHLAPEAAARLEDEGVANPDRVLTDLIERQAPAIRRAASPK